MQDDLRGNTMAVKSDTPAETESVRAAEAPVKTGTVVKSEAGQVNDLLSALLADGVNPQPDPLAIAKAIMGEATIDGGNPEDAGKAIVARLLMAESIDEVLSTNNVIGAEALLNATIEVHGVKWQPSGYDQGPKVYALIDCTDVITGQRQLVSCGGQNVMAQLLRIQVDNGFPQRVKIVQSARATAAGNYPMWLEKGDAPAAQESMPY